MKKYWWTICQKGCVIGEGKTGRGSKAGRASRTSKVGKAGKAGKAIRVQICNTQSWTNDTGMVYSRGSGCIPFCSRAPLAPRPLSWLLSIRALPVIHSPDSILRAKVNEHNDNQRLFMWIIKEWNVNLRSCHRIITLFMLFISNRLNFTAMPITSPFIYVECTIVYQMTIFVHVTNRPIAQLAVIDDATRRLLTISSNLTRIFFNVLEMKNNDIFTYTKMHGTWIWSSWCIPFHIRPPIAPSTNPAQSTWRTDSSRLPGKSILRNINKNRLWEFSSAKHSLG